ncbi:unnamed protein product [Spirodela intermedia]|uniref:Uncharacterized protein n=1 Tax=Spirodela intermedia TaxID=51605 RepID=A0A7I8J497_SPIIN|nr:unnamed protein product [Spirodela intermedia]CAA6664929.1 unnamed protein product [Spirodela intermedia]
MAGVASEHHRSIGAFNPAWCLRPPVSGGDLARRWADGPSSSLSLSSPASSLSWRPSASRRRRPSANAEPLSPALVAWARSEATRLSPPPPPAAAAPWGCSGSNVLSMATPRALCRRQKPPPLRCSVAPTGVCLTQLDPPLPVVKRPSECGAVCIWKRRRCGEVLPLEAPTSRRRRRASTASPPKSLHGISPTPIQH